MPPRLSAPCDRALRAKLKERKESLRAIEAKTGIRFTTLADYERGEASKDGESYKTNLTLPQAEALAKYFGMQLKLVKP
jgi:transcriptional regulator with XRE-family HTH domain